MHFNLAFFTFNGIFLSAMLWSSYRPTSPNRLLKQVNSYTPLLDAYDLAFHTRTPNASLYNVPYSIYKDNPSPAVDAAWEKIADTPILVISRADVIRMGKDPEYAVQVPLDFGYGEDGFFAVNDGQHLIHCLNEVREFAFSSHYYNDSSPLTQMQAAHRSSCIGVLLDALTCQPSLGMVLWEWVEGQAMPEPDFGVQRMCIKQDVFREWMDKSEVDRSVMKGWNGKWDGGKSRNNGSGGKTRVKVVPPEAQDGTEFGHDNIHHQDHV
ncbi:hypothetical protein ST47_g136 [Ascochyta rabiei]|uniref:Transferase n=1 Tax=Didymella rabiei TaxID=5454 RepID=A0A163MHS7_DIDRA|nr:hypothetical protein ST47_g136 [Ascochyta rabiei]